MKKETLPVFPQFFVLRQKKILFFKISNKVENTFPANDRISKCIGVHFKSFESKLKLVPKVVDLLTSALSNAGNHHKEGNQARSMIYVQC